MTRTTITKVLALVLLFSLTFHVTHAQNIGGVVNIYTPVTAISGCANHILTVESAQGFAVGDKVLLIQMQGASINLTNSSNFGNYVGSNNAGLYEMNRIDNITGNQIQLHFKTFPNYNLNGKVQLIRVPEYVDATVTSPLTCQPWNGSIGGVLAIDVSGTLTLESDIDVSAKGFRGGTVVDANAAPYGELGYFYAPNPIVSGQKGEGIAIVSLDKSYGRGKAANGGGAGNSHNGGGGGGGNAGAGGFGGLEYHNLPDTPTPGTNGIGGLGGNGRAIMGGGGGAGHTNDEHGSSGGNGGGVVMLKVNIIVGNSKNILANGESVVSIGTERNDGQGGGGAGGTIVIHENQLVGNVTCSANGGKGGDCLFYVPSQIIGPGGGGGGGVIRRNLPSPGMTMIRNGGENGIANQNMTNGATKGGIGVTLTGDVINHAFQPIIIEISQTQALCPGQTISLGGQNYIAPDTIVLTLPGLGGSCDTLATYNLILKPQVSINENIGLCLGETVNLGGQSYTAPDTVNLTFPGLGDECDTLAIYNLTLKPQISITENITLCPGETVSLGGQNYTAPATVNLTFPGLGTDCDTLAIYNLTLKPQVSINENIALCPGETVSLGGQIYTAPDSVNLTLSGLGGACDTLATYNLILNSQPTINQTIEFCPGEIITLGGTEYTQPGTVILSQPAAIGCDTIATYVLNQLTPAPSNVSIACPANVSVISSPGTGPVVVNYPDPVAASDCPCPGTALRLTAGLPSGGLFPPTTTQVCWQAADSCGQTASCCFLVTVREESPCDIKTIGCMKYELLSITEDAEKNRTYRIQVTNSCANKMSYTAIQIPNGMIAMNPANNSMYTAPSSGREYLVRNPNFSPFYSVRFKSMDDSLSSGASDVFRYTLPAQANVTYIHILSRLEPQVYYEAHLNTFNCPIGVTPPGGGKPGEERADYETNIKNIRLFPNPTSGALFADFSAWAGQDLQVRVMDSRGQTVLQRSVLAGADAQSIGLPETLPNGLYFLEIIPSGGDRTITRFVRVGE